MRKLHPILFSMAMLLGGSTVYAGGPCLCTTKPATPASIQVSGGSAKVCPGETRTYCVGSADACNTYQWTPPAGASIVSGQGTSCVVVSYDPGFTYGRLQVNASNACGTSANKGLSVYKNTAPSMPIGIAITGGTTVCPGEIRTVSITAVPGITYVWTVPAGVTILSGQGTGSISVQFNNALLATSNIGAASSNTCGTSLPRTLTIYRGTAAPMPALPTGNAGLCNQSSATVAVTNVPGTSYQWSLAPGVVSILSGQGTHSVNFDLTGWTSSSYSVSVTATNGCGTSAPRMFKLMKSPSPPASITGLSAVCPAANSIYRLSTSSGATQYKWSASGLGFETSMIYANNMSAVTAEDSIRVYYPNSLPATGNYVTLLAYAGNSCGWSSAKTLRVYNNCSPRMEEEVSALEVYPNPAKDLIHLNSEQLVAGEQVDLNWYDMTGKLIRSENLIFDGTELITDRSNLPAGLYILHVNSEHVSEKVRLTIE